MQDLYQEVAVCYRLTCTHSLLLLLGGPAGVGSVAGGASPLNFNQFNCSAEPMGCSCLTGGGSPFNCKATLY
jgi:hypothetical protein